jgi:hypothetical protein
VAAEELELGRVPAALHTGGEDGAFQAVAAKITYAEAGRRARVLTISATA